MRIECLRGREVGGQVGRYDLEDMLRANEVLQTVSAEVRDGDSRRQAVAHQFLSSKREEDLTAVGCSQEACHAVERLTEVIALPFLSCSSMQRHPHSDRTVGAPRLTRDGPLSGQPGMKGIGCRDEGS